LLRLFLAACLGLLFCGNIVQAANKDRRVMVLAYGAPFLQAADGLRQGLRKRGSKSGLEFEIHNLNRDISQVSMLLNKAREDKFDLIFSLTTPVTRMVKKVIDQDPGWPIPVVFAVVADPLGSGIVANLRHPGGKITGISHSSLELLPQRLLFFKQAFPAMQRVVIFFNPNEGISKRSYNDRLLHQAAQDCHLELVARKVCNQKELEVHCQALVSHPGQVDGIFMLPDALSVNHFKALLKLSRDLRIPLMVIDNILLQKGGVLGYSPDFAAVGEQAAIPVQHIFAGSPPGDIPVQNADRVRLVISLREAHRLGLEFSNAILMQADEVLR
jgi:putative ABC transport system substrate-binding protein